MERDDGDRKIRRIVFLTLGVLLSGVAMYFVWRSFSGSFRELSQAAADVDWRWFGAASLMYAVSFFCMAWLWMCIQREGDDKIGRLEYLDIFITSSFARYIPGGVWNIVGKAAWCVKRGASPYRTSGAICAEYLFQIASSLCFLLVFLPVIFRFSVPAGYAACVCGICVIVFLPFLVRLGLRLLGKVSGDSASYALSAVRIYALLGGYVAMWITVGIGFAVLCRAVDHAASAAVWRFALAYPVAWVAGFLSPSPNGIGVREFVLQLFGDGTVGSAHLVVLLVAARCWTMIGEGLAFVGIRLLRLPGGMRSGKDEKAARIVFISTKNRDYIRNTQEIRLLRERCGDVTVIASSSGSYLLRVIHVYLRLCFTPSRHVAEWFCGFAPQLVLPFWYWKFRRKKITVDFFISLYDTLVCDRRLFRDGSWMAGLLRRWDELTLRLADEIICDTRAHGGYFVSELHAEPRKLRVLYLEADSEYYDPGKYPEHHFDGRVMNVLYFGSILPLQGVDTIIDAALLLRERSDIRFTLIGPLKAEQRRRLGATAARIIEHLTQRELAGEIAGADLCLAGHFSATVGKAARTIPGKAYIYRAMGRPMILGDTPANRELFGEADPGVVFSPPGDAAALAAKIAEFRDRLAAMD